MTDLESQIEASVRARKNAVWAEHKEPWALRNVRLYQNMASRYWAQYYKTDKRGD